MGVNGGYINVRKIGNRQPTNGITQYFIEDNTFVFNPACKTIWGTDIGFPNEIGYNILVCRDNTNNYQIKLRNDFHFQTDWDRFIPIFIINTFI